MPSHDDVLYVTHDYYVNVISKTQLMLATARFAKYCKKENVVFATPKDYDHYGFQNPEANYLKAEKAIRE